MVNIVRSKMYVGNENDDVFPFSANRVSKDARNVPDTRIASGGGTNLGVNCFGTNT